MKMARPGLPGQPDIAANLPLYFVRECYGQDTYSWNGESVAIKPVRSKVWTNTSLMLHQVVTFATVAKRKQPETHASMGEEKGRRARGQHPLTAIADSTFCR
jgi:hypothetical protein